MSTRAGQEDTGGTEFPFRQPCGPCGRDDDVLSVLSDATTLVFVPHAHKSSSRHSGNMKQVHTSATTSSPPAIVADETSTSNLMVIEQSDPTTVFKETPEMVDRPTPAATVALTGVKGKCCPCYVLLKKMRGECYFN